MSFFSSIRSWFVRRKAASFYKELRRLILNKRIGREEGYTAKSDIVWCRHVAKNAALLKRHTSILRTEAAQSLGRAAATNRRVGVHYCVHRDPVVYIEPTAHPSAIPTVPLSNPSPGPGYRSGYALLIPQLPKIKAMKSKVGLHSFEEV